MNNCVILTLMTTNIVLTQLFCVKLRCCGCDFMIQHIFFITYFNEKVRGYFQDAWSFKFSS